MPLGPFHDPNLMWYSDEPDPTDPSGTRRMTVVGPAPDAWVALVIHGALFDISKLDILYGGKSLYELPLKDGVTITTKADYVNATERIAKTNKAAMDAFFKSIPGMRAEAYDARAKRYRKLGWDEADIVAEFGPHPGNVKLPPVRRKGEEEHD